MILSGNTAITIGTLDGVHLGHAGLLRVGREAVGKGGRVVALVFDPHPASVLRPGSEPARLTTFAQRKRLLREAGADEVERLEPTAELLGQSPAEFLRSVVERWKPSAVVEGGDFHFGRGRAGTPRVLAALGQDLGFCTIIAPAREAVLSDHAVVRCSSTLARWLVSQGRVHDAGAVLGRGYELEGEVVRGDRRGRAIGFPTANVVCGQLLPADGVYAAEAVMPGGEVLGAAVNVGARPTFSGVERRVEAHVLAEGLEGRGVRGPADWQPLEGVAEYGWTLRLRLRAFVRDQVRFASVGDLVAQLERDVARVRSMLNVLAPMEREEVAR